jgi:aspartyl-tRNA(Asn)/glutamyl-tRNA(Gln) amidotransferase subunit C
MKLDLAQVEHIAELAKLELTDNEKATFQEQLSAILEYADRLNQVDTSAIPPTPTVLPLCNVMREDVVKPSLPIENALGNAPDTAEGCVQVKIILDWSE